MNQKALRHELAFADYAAMGPDRSISKIAKKYTVSLGAAVKWSIKGHWQDRVKEMDAKAAADASRKAGDTLLEMNDRHIWISKKGQAEYIKKLKEQRVDPSTADVVQLIKLERAIRGSPVPEGPEDLSGEGGDVETVILEQSKRIIASRTRRSRAS